MQGDKFFLVISIFHGVLDTAELYAREDLAEARAKQLAESLGLDYEDPEGWHNDENDLYVFEVQVRSSLQNLE